MIRGTSVIEMRRRGIVKWSDNDVVDKADALRVLRAVEAELGYAA